jgi:hypothetical protein
VGTAVNVQLWGVQSSERFIQDACEGTRSKSRHRISQDTNQPWRQMRLHSYGFMDKALLVFIVSQLALVALCLLPPSPPLAERRG